MPIHSIISFFEWFFIISFVIMNIGYLIMSMLSIGQLKGLIKSKITGVRENDLDGIEMPVSILVPAYNESVSIVESIESMLQLRYLEYEIIIINDGSTDNTLRVLKEAFALEKIHIDNEFNITTKRIRQLYQSSKYPQIRVIDKENGGKADSLNAGINASSFPLFCSVDADSILDRDSLKSVVQPFIKDATVIASGGTIRIANGCKVRNGKLEEVGVPRNPLALSQVVEYLHSFLFGRLGWVPINGLLVLSGAFSVFLNIHVIDTGGYRTDIVGEDMELVLRMHKYMREKGEPYNIAYTPEPVCWTEAPEDIKTLQNQRIRWHKGLGESLAIHYEVFLNRKMGVIGFVAFPFALFFELLTPILEFIGYLFYALGFYFGVINSDAFIAFLFVSVGLGILISIGAILLEEITFQAYKKKSYIFMLLVGAIIENVGYRQLNTVWRFTGLVKFVFNSRLEWGKMKRHGKWHSKAN